MKTLRSIVLAAAASIPALSSAAPTLQVCYDDAAGGFNYGTATCVVDGGVGDLLAGISGAITVASFLTGGLTITSSIGEPLFAPGFGLSISVDGTVSGKWIVAVSQTGLEYGAPAGSPLTFGATFSGSTSAGPGTAAYSVYVDDANRNLDVWGPFGTEVAGGGPFSGVIGDTSSGPAVTVSDPFSVLAFLTFDATNGATYYSTDLTTTVPEPASLALVGLALVGLAAARRRKA